jgi:uroporphyrinogen-III synthase
VIPPLAGWTVAVTADRRAEEQVVLLERRGATTVHAPTVRTLPLVEGDQLTAAIDCLITDPPDIVVLLTGIGTRGLVAAAEGIGRDADLLAALASSTVVARGPKAAGAATTVGFDVAWHAESERSMEIYERLRSDAARGARIAVQRDGAATPLLADSLRVLGGRTLDIPVYRWELPLDTRPALRLVDAIVDRAVDAVTFTSRPAIVHLVELAAEMGRAGAMVDAFNTDVLPVCVGPVCAEAAMDAGLRDAVVPRRARLGAMVQNLAASVSERSRTIVRNGATVTLQGRAVFVDGALTTLGSRERSVLEHLLDAAGAVVPKGRLLRAVWGPEFDDDHAVEVAVGRLRRGLGPAGASVETVPRRGYRLAS